MHGIENPHAFLCIKKSRPAIEVTTTSHQGTLRLALPPLPQADLEESLEPGSPELLSSRGPVWWGQPHFPKPRKHGRDSWITPGGPALWRDGEQFFFYILGMKLEGTHGYCDVWHHLGFWFFGRAHGMHKFRGQGLNLSHSRDPSRCSATPHP